jgi:5-methylcytosine-specific restriction protein A
MFLYNNEEDIPYKKIEGSIEQDNVNSATEPIDTCNTHNGIQINKKPWVSKRAIKKSNYTCEFDSTHKTFITNEGHYYMEGHHLICCTVENSNEIWKKYERNIDTEANIISLCPTCHKRIHFGNEKETMEILTDLYNKRIKELNKNGIYITLNELKNKYLIKNI